MCESDPLAEYAQEEEPEVDLMQRAQVRYKIFKKTPTINGLCLWFDDVDPC